MTQTKPAATSSRTGKWKPYPAYKESGVEWLGEIPEHWDIFPLKRLAKIRYGLGQPPAQLEEGTPFVRATNVKSGIIVDEGMLYVDFKDIPQDRDAVLSSGEIIVVRSGAYTGDSAIVPKNFEGAIAGYDMVVTITKGYSPFFAWQLLSREVRGLQFNFFNLRAAQPHLNSEDLGNTLYLVPPLPEQHAIASFLDHETARINALIAKKERLIELLQEKRAALISHAVTKGLDPTVLMKDSGVEWLGEIPVHWEVKRLKFVADVLNGVTKGRDLGQREVVELPYLRVANVQDGYLDLSDIAMIIVGVDEVEHYSLQRGDVLMNEGGDFDKLGRGYVWDGAITPCLHQNHVFAVRPHLGVDSYWISMITLTSYAKHYFILKSKQSTNLASISGTNLKELPVLMPPEDERNAILNYIKVTTAKIDTLISRIQEDIEKLKEYSSALISAAVTGKIDVRETVADYSEDR